jgi:hypothetical protein
MYDEVLGYVGQDCTVHEVELLLFLCRSAERC